LRGFKKKAFSTVILVLLVAIIFPLPRTAYAQEEDGDRPEEFPPQDSWNGTLVFWDKEHSTSQESWSWLSQSWEFGPYPNFAVYLLNGTPVTDSNYVPLGELFKVVIEVQKAIFTENATLGRAGVNWHKDLRSQNGTWTGFADCRMVYINKMETKYWNESNTWQIESRIFNGSADAGPRPLPPIKEDQPPSLKEGGVPLLLVASDLSEGDTIFDRPEAPTVDRTVEKTVSGTIRLVNYVNISGTPSAYELMGWDRSTGILCEYTAINEERQGIDNFTSVMVNVALTETNLWNVSTPGQSLPATGTTTYTPGVSVGDAANYTVTALWDSSDPMFRYAGPPNGTANAEVLEVDGSNVKLSVTILDSDSGNEKTEILWIDVATGEIGGGFSPPSPPTGEQMGFYQFNRTLSKVTENDEMWTIEFVGSFNATSTPMGPFWVNLEVTDSSDHWIDFGYVAWSGKTSPNRMIAVGKPGLVYGGFGDTWTFQKLDMEDKEVYSVSRGALWKMRVNVTSSELVNVTLAFDLDWGLRTYVNVTGWYQTTVTEYGGWMYNETAGTYYWNSTVPVTRTVQVYGPHLEERWVSREHEQKTVNVTRRIWNYTTGEEELVNFTETIWNEKLFMIYDHFSHTFAVKQGYSYWSYDPRIYGEREHQVLGPLNVSDPATRFYNLSISDCGWQQTGPREYMIEFVGYFSNETFSDRDRYWIQQPVVYSEHGQIWANWEDIDSSDFEIAVDKLVAITTIIDDQGREVKGGMFQVDQGDFFTIRSKLQGANVKYSDIDGFGVVFRGGEGRWTANESYWSDVEVRLVKDLTEDKMISETYNRTCRDSYVYGPYMGWALVNVTDWHEEYNSTSGKWEWVESPYLMWNYTEMVGWHWEHLNLNQTEYALDPDSPNIWINRDETWIPNDDPAFRMPTSYAAMNSANISLVEGIVTVDLNISFSPDAPSCRYWWDLTFKNLTYSRDWSQGWGDHKIIEWTSEPVYYVNGTATNSEPWYATKPSTPLYTIYNGKRYLLEEAPYIVIGGEKLPLKARIYYDWGRQEDVKEYLFWDPYNPKLGKQPRYYELLNGTKIYVNEGYRALIRTLTLNCTEAYKTSGTVPVSLPNRTVFNTFMDRAEQDWSKRIWNESLGHEVVPYYYELLNGTRVYRNEGFETQTYNYTTYRWDLSDPVYTDSVTSLMVDRAGQGVALNYTTIVLLRDMNSWWQPLLDGTGYYLVMKNGTRIIVADPWVSDEERIVTLNGKNYLISWPQDYYKAVYQDQTFLIRGGGWQGYVRNFYYTDLGKTGGEKHELPYPGAMATSWWDLEGIESEGRKLKTFKAFTLNGAKYVLQRDVGGGYYVIVDGSRVSVTPPAKDLGYYYCQINGEEYWNVTQNGWSLYLGEYSYRSGQLTPSSSFITTTGYDLERQTWTEYNRYGYDRENSTCYLQAANGTRYDVHSEIRFCVWKVEIGGKNYYTLDPYGQWEMEEIGLGQTVYKSYIVTLNGTKVYFDWERKPCNWVEEIYVPVPGTNYTRLVPFTWQTKQVFDTVYIYNITISALPWNPTHTEVFYDDGTEVPVGATLKAYGTARGPGTQGNYDQEGNLFAWLPSMQAPWNDTVWVGYMTALNGTSIYSQYHFGWMGDRWGDPESGELRQWNYTNDDPFTGNVTAKVVESGYRIYLNNTVRLDVTTSYMQGGMPDQYLILTNGSYLPAHWNDERHCYVTVIGGNVYWFRSPITYYNVTDMDTVYNLQNSEWEAPDPYQTLTPTMFLVPTIATDRSTWIWMNATSDAVLRDMEGYYLVNASDLSKLSLGLVDDWWNLSERLRVEVFSQVWELEEAYPRFNVTIQGQEYFVIDPSPVTCRWEGEQSVEWSLDRYPSTVDVALDGTVYTVTVINRSSSCWNPEIRWRRYNQITSAGGAVLEVEDQWQWKPALQVSINGVPTELQQASMNIYKEHTACGEIYRWMLTDLNVHTVRNIWDLVVGIPESGMWGFNAFTVVPETGAVDLDGDLTTAVDQYFVRRIHQGSDSWNQTVDRMWVELVWNPNSSMVGDEMHIGAWMGKLRVSWSFTWNETYIWYYASNSSVVSAETMEQINATVIDSETGMPNAGYWEIARMARNATWADLLDQAKREGWDWIQDNTNTWEWIWFGVQQDYRTSWMEAGVAKWADIGLRYEFAGLSLYNNTEQTHFFMPVRVGNVSFVTPGEAFGNTNATGSMLVPGDETVTFGVSYDDVNGTLFPYYEDKSMWGWWGEVSYGADFRVPDFMKKPTKALIDDLSFAVHFSANVTADQELNNEASMKIDQRIGDWLLDHQVIDGRAENVSGVMVRLRGNEVLLNRSLAVNHYVTAFTSIGWEVKDERGTSVDNNNVTESSTFNVAASLADAEFATVKLGSTYDWGKPVGVNDTIRTLNVTSKTSPLETFNASYLSESGKSSTGFDITATMYFLTVAFPKWDGYAVYNDPQVSTSVSKGVAEAQPPPPGPTPPGPQPEEGAPFPLWPLVAVITAGAVLVPTILFIRRRRRTATAPTH